MWIKQEAEKISLMIIILFWSESDGFNVLMFQRTTLRYRTDLDEGGTERFEDALWQRGLSAMSERSGQKQRRLLLNGRVLIVHHSQDVL